MKWHQLSSISHRFGTKYFSIVNNRVLSLLFQWSVPATFCNNKLCICIFHAYHNGPYEKVFTLTINRCQRRKLLRTLFWGLHPVNWSRKIFVANIIVEFVSVRTLCCKNELNWTVKDHSNFRVIDSALIRGSLLSLISCLYFLQQTD